MTRRGLFSTCVGYLGSSKAPPCWTRNTVPGDRLQRRWVEGASPTAALHTARLKFLEVTGRSLRVLRISGNPTQACIRLSTQIQWLLRRSWPRHRPGGKTVSSRTAPLKGLAQRGAARGVWHRQAHFAWWVPGKHRGAACTYKRAYVHERSQDHLLSSSYVMLALVFSICKAGLAGAGFTLRLLAVVA